MCYRVSREDNGTILSYAYLSFTPDRLDYLCYFQIGTVMSFSSLLCLITTHAAIGNKRALFLNLPSTLLAGV